MIARGRRMTRGNTVRAASLALAGLAATVTLAGCGSGGPDSGGMTINDRNAAQTALNALQTSNIPTTILNLTSTAGRIPAACNVHLLSSTTFKVYLFWVPYIGPSAYSWLDMTITKDPTQDKFHYATAPAVLPSGIGLGGAEAPVAGYIDYDLPLAKLSGQAAVNKKVLLAHAGNVYSKPDTPCQVLKNGYLRLLPNP